jgi:hypothetical protein
MTMSVLNMLYEREMISPLSQNSRVDNLPLKIDLVLKQQAVFLSSLIVCHTYHVVKE